MTTGNTGNLEVTWGVFLMTILPIFGAISLVVFVGYATYCAILELLGLSLWDWCKFIGGISASWFIVLWATNNLGR